MGTTLGLVGLPNVGKSSLFNALTRGKTQVAPYPFTTTSPHTGVAPVEDGRLQTLAEIIPHDQVIPTTVECVDIAGIVKGAHQGEGLGNEFLSHILAVDAILHVVRCFKKGEVAHVMGQPDPVRDMGIINTELLLKDLEIVERRLEKEHKLAKGGEKQAKARVESLIRCQEALNNGTAVRKLSLEPHEHPRAFGVELLTSKPVIYVANVGEEAAEHQGDALGELQRAVEEEGAGLVVLCVKLEAELAELEPADRMVMMKELEVSESALPRVITKGYEVLRQITFFSTASRILQGWTVAKGSTAPQAAGTIHSEFERLFIRAEVISVEMLSRCGGEAKAKAQGKLRLEGKDYVVQDGDVMRFRLGQAQ